MVQECDRLLGGGQERENVDVCVSTVCLCVWPERGRMCIYVCVCVCVCVARKGENVCVHSVLCVWVRTHTQRIMSCCCWGWGRGGGGGGRQREWERERWRCCMYLLCYGKKRVGLSKLSSQPLLPRSLPPQLLSTTNPLPSFPKAACPQTVKVQSDSCRGLVQGGWRGATLRLCETATNKISEVSLPRFRLVVLV